MEEHPLIKATTGNKLLVAAFTAGLTAVSAWAVTGILEVKSTVGELQLEGKNLHEWLRENETTFERMELRIDQLYDIIGKDMLIRSIDENTDGKSN